MATTFQSLLVGYADGWHDGDKTITYSFIGAEVPAYYREKDLNGDGTNDAWKVANGKFASMTEGVSMTPTERALVSPEPRWSNHATRWRSARAGTWWVQARPGAV